MDTTIETVSTCGCKKGATYGDGIPRDHAASCSQAPIEEQLQWHEKQHRFWYQKNINRRDFHKKQIDKITFWKGKYHILKAENNALRKMFRILAGKVNPEKIWNESSSDRFWRLEKELNRDNKNISFITELNTHPACEQIIGMGFLAIPFIFVCMDTDDFSPYMFSILSAITGEDPVPVEHRGNTLQMKSAWITWAIRNKVIKR